ncbi:MAG: hypothetical protein AABZ65_06040 [Candidatus Omnitrophota bacterium]
MKRQREGFNKLFNSEPLEADNCQSVLAIQLIMRVLSASASAGSALLTESLDKLYEVISKKILEGLSSLLSSENKIKVVGYLRNLRLGDLKLGEIKELPGNLKKLIDKTKQPPGDSAKTSKAIGEVESLCDSINAEEIMAKALELEKSVFIDLSIERSYSESGANIRIGKTTFKYVKVNSVKAMVDITFYREISDATPALTITFESYVNGGTIREVKLNFETGEYTILQLQNLSVDIIKALEYLYYLSRDKDSADEVVGWVPEIASSALTITKKPEVIGGIDFRQMNMLVQPAGSFTGLDFSLPMLSRAEIESFDLEKELADIRHMVRRGIAPSGQRLKEYLAACFEKGETKDKIDSFILCLADIFELQQFEAREASPEYKEALVIADTRRYIIKEDRFYGSKNNSYSLN